ncbi:peptidase [Herbaspirillum hiltneri N3]|uniref:Peptidase n=1 Tax=Herbaspirillum hiltneri N3 TaxID=1262470 RepID=A0ABM5V125_9BURK|nr:tRNA (adenosine(37)-N6)-threonylcarbamoyltransferase complex dimerization subunit type 1 TsaB [Herbaspirillum hiltneri]AKZ63211.1 peptidase [Herbaspirillum hiltneri N3]
MSIILAIETSTELASAALLHGDELIFRESMGVQTHSETILPMVQQLLAQAGIALSRCDAIAFGVGPGSFTGVRTACGVVQGLAFGSDLPVAPVVTLEAMAQACLETTQGVANDVLAVLDARMGEVYWAQYRHGADGWDVVLAPSLSSAAAVAPQGHVQACGNGLAAYAQDFAPQPFAAAALAQLMPHAAQVATLGRRMAAQGKTVSLLEAQPLYLRNKVALTTAERQVRDLAKGAA